MVSFSKEAPKVHQNENDLPPENKTSASKTNRFQTVFPQSQKITFQKMIETKIFQKVFCNDQNQKKDLKRGTKYQKIESFLKKKIAKRKGKRILAKENQTAAFERDGRKTP